MNYERPILKELNIRLKEPHRKIQILSGARQVGKTTLIKQALNKISSPHIYKIAESGFTTTWLDQQWALARALEKQSTEPIVLVIDEIQKIQNWSERIKRLWDEDTYNNARIQVVLLGSSSLLLHKGLNESMAGRYELLHIPHWSFSECRDAFDLSLEEYCYFGAYPGALVYKNDEKRFLSYMEESIVEPVVSRDILSQFIIHKPALLKQLFKLGSTYSGQILSFNKMLGQLHDAGNATTLSHYLSLLDQANVIKGLNKYSPNIIKQRQSSPKLQVYNNAFLTASSQIGFREWKQSPKLKGRWVESMIGAHLSQDPRVNTYYWRENNEEVDFVVEKNGKVFSLEVKSAKKKNTTKGQEIFANKFAPDATLLIGEDGIPVEFFLTSPIETFLP